MIFSVSINLSFTSCTMPIGLCRRWFHFAWSVSNAISFWCISEHTCTVLFLCKCTGACFTKTREMWLQTFTKSKQFRQILWTNTARAEYWKLSGNSKTIGIFPSITAWQELLPHYLIVLFSTVAFNFISSSYWQMEPMARTDWRWWNQTVESFCFGSFWCLANDAESKIQDLAIYFLRICICTALLLLSERVFCSLLAVLWPWNYMKKIQIGRVYRSYSQLLLKFQWTVQCIFHI